MEHAVLSQLTVCHGLSAVAECVRQRLDPVVAHVQRLRLLLQLERHLTSLPNNRALRNVSRHAETFGISLVAHAFQLGDSLVISLCLVDSTHRQPSQGAEDRYGEKAKLGVGMHGISLNYYSAA